jgi:hypothetical protein
MTKAEHQLETGKSNVQTEMDLGYATRDLANAMQGISDQAIEFKQRIEPEAQTKPESAKDVAAWATRMKAGKDDTQLQP